MSGLHKPGVVGDSCFTCDSSTWEVEAGGSEVQGLSQINSKFKASVHCMKSYVEKKKKPEELKKMREGERRKRRRKIKERKRKYEIFCSEVIATS